jgi:hypothetical protein
MPVLQILLMNGFDDLVRIVFRNHMDFEKIKTKVTKDWKTYSSIPLLYEIINQDFDFFFSVLSKHDTTSIPGLIKAGPGETPVDLKWILQHTSGDVVAQCVVLLVDIDFERVDEHLERIIEILYPKVYALSSDIVAFV